MLSVRHLPTAEPVHFPRLELPKLELCFHDGSRVWLRQVNNNPLVRQVENKGEVIELDLCQLVPGLHEEFHGARAGDRPGVIFFTLRERFKNAGEFLQAVAQLHAPGRVN